MSNRRMVPFLFRVLGRDGREQFSIFYAASAAQATSYARQWSQRLSLGRIELVDEERST